MMKKHGLHSLELKALSVPSSLRFMLGVEYEVVYCVTEAGNRRPCTIRFPLVATTFRKLLELCAERFGLECVHHEDHSLLSGTAMMPTLRYIDYLPGALHVEELLECLGVKPSTSAKRDGNSAHDFVASFIDYSEYRTDTSLTDVHGTGFYLTLDYGLSTATHSHLVEIQFHKGCSIDEALREFGEFSGWNTFDLRFYDENDKRAGGIVVMPSIQDACDLFEKYEDEDSDDEGELLQFILRPVSPLVPVPSVEDSALKKLRDQHWGEIVKHWERFSRWRNCVVVSNLYESASLEDTLAFFDGLPITASSLVEDNSPARRRRVFVTFATSDAAKKALLLDGRSTKGKTLRVQVSPPYIDESRRGRVVGSHPTSPSDDVVRHKESAQRTVSSSPPLQQEKRDVGTTAGYDVSTHHNRDRNNSKRDHEDKRWNTPAQVGSPQIVSVSSSAQREGLGSSNIPVQSTTNTNTNTTAAAAAAAPQTTLCNTPPVTSTMNANAKEFIPSTAFHPHAASPEMYPSPMLVPYVEEHLLPPPAYNSVPMTRPINCTHRSPRLSAAPPPYTAPPSYAVATQVLQLVTQNPPSPPPPPPPSSL
ncbi:uncharacterized protein TM35_000043580 [Trypanosoma theileri]|uniref:RRM domain-containing protein n=1 Tax=Trypanosoma theileri TaxID=67003 RepID=A0A1X0P5B8_9TRYP|nr:uncharacterized protein TM35_000043580 [Trypanosoma theileri]ORC92144.1 hypothetical protein TM35_000043580 [Trypanosoma theileri]